MSNNSKNLGSLIAGILLIGLGLLALVGQLFSALNFWKLAWPFIIIGIGVVFFAVMFSGGRSVSGFAIPGSIICAIGLILLYQNLTRHWESWSYAWTVIVIAVGVGIAITGRRSSNPRTQQAGLGIAKLGVILLVAFGLFFETLIFGSYMRRGLRQLVFPVLLILLGVYLLISPGALRFFRSAREQPASDAIPPESTTEAADE